LEPNVRNLNPRIIITSLEILRSAPQTAAIFACRVHLHLHLHLQNSLMPESRSITFCLSSGDLIPVAAKINEFILRDYRLFSMEHLEYRPPWFTLQVIGIAGASASGKTSVARAILKKLNVPLP